MEQRDLELIERLILTDHTLRKLYQEHLEYERRLEEFKTRPALTSQEEIEKKNIKKYKLRGRDQIEFILRKHRQAV